MANPMRIFPGITSAFLVSSTFFLSSASLSASDHLDSPFIDEHPQADIGDTWAFPTENGAVLVISFNPLTDPSQISQMKLDQDVLYEFKLDTDGDNVADLAYKISVEGQGQEQKLTVRRAKDAEAISVKVGGEIVLQGRTSVGSEVHINEADGFRLFVGARQDPFFFNFKGVQSPVSLELQYALGSDGLPSDGSWVNTFGPTNMTLLALEVKELKGKKYGVWATTALDDKQVDRCGRASVTAIFLPRVATGRNPKSYPFGGFKQAYNETRPVDDRDNYGKMFAYTLGQLQADKKRTEFYLPDILQYDPSLPDAYPNGRNFYDDAVFWTMKDINPFQETPAGLPERNPQNLSKEFPFAAPPIPDPMSARNEYMVKLVNDIYTGMHAGDFSEIAAQCSPTVEWTCYGPEDAAFTGTFNGKAGIDDHFRKLSAAYRIDKVEVLRTVVEGSFVAAIVRETGVDVTTKKLVVLNATQCWEVTDNRISRVRDYVSIAEPKEVK